MNSLLKLIKRWKYRHIEEVILVDSENVGYQIPTEIPVHTLIYVFVSDPFIFNKLNYHKQIRYIDISKIRKKCSTKNIMDFCIIAKMSEIVTYFSRPIKIVLCSKDKGYDASIYFLKERYAYIDFKRYPGSLLYYYSFGNDDLAKILQNADKTLLNIISLHNNMNTLKKVLNKKQKEVFVIKKYTNLIGMVKTYIELDIYNMTYHVYYSGNLMGSYESKEEAFDLYHQYVDKLHQQYDKYETHEKFVRSNELNIRHYIEEAFLKKQTLEECLIAHLGENQGRVTYQLYMNDYCH